METASISLPNRNDLRPSGLVRRPNWFAQPGRKMPEMLGQFCSVEIEARNEHETGGGHGSATQELAASEFCLGEGLFGFDHAKMSLTICPSTSVSRNRRPW